MASKKKKIKHGKSLKKIIAKIKPKNAAKAIKNRQINKNKAKKIVSGGKKTITRDLGAKKLIEEVVRELVGEEALPVVFYLRGKKHVSEFKIAEDVNEEIHRTRNILYRLFENNIVFFKRKKDKVKGWYICYWDINEGIFPYLKKKIVENKLEKLKQRLKKENDRFFYMCKNACVRMDFEKAVDFNFKCPECGELMNEQDNKRTIEFIQERIKELEVEQNS